MRSRRSETIDFRGIAAITRAAIPFPRSRPPWDPPEFSWETEKRAGWLQKSLRERFGRHLRRSSALLRPVLLRKSVSGAILTPKFVQNGLQNLSKMVRETASEFDLVFLYFRRFFQKICMILKMQRYAKNPRAMQVSLKICKEFEDCNF